jgi:hypothetical protein
MSTDPRWAATAYFDSWRARDFARFRALLAEDVSFVGPLAALRGVEPVVAGITKMSEIVTDIVVEKMFVDGPDVLTWFELHTSVAPPCPTANWSHVENGEITAIRVAFDPRPLTGGG